MRRVCLAGAALLSACTLSQGETSDDQALSTGQGASRGACTPSVPAAPMQRLTQAQYTASVKKALGLTSLPTLDLPADQAAGPFAANSAAVVTDLGVSQYQEAATLLAAAAAPQLAKGLSCGAAPMAEACVAPVLATAGLALYRRPLSDEEVAAYTGLAKPYLSQGNLQTALTQALSGLLQSPFFLYRPEFGAPAAAGGRVALTDVELAGRLAFFLTGAPPDASLLAAAAAGQLSDPNGRLKQVNALAQTAAFDLQVSQWVSQWLALSPVAGASKDPALFPAFTPALAAAMDAEVAAFVAWILASPTPSLEALLTSPTGTLSGPLYGFYGATPPPQGGPQVVALDGRTRGGILSRGAFLASHAHGNAQSSAVLRGHVLRSNLLCQNLPAPPANVPTLAPVVPSGLTARQIFAIHESQPSCAACHTLMDPLGLGLETYDNIGAARTEENGAPIDTSGQLSGTPTSDGPFADAPGLIARLAASPDLHACVVSQMFRFAMGRLEGAQDSCSLQQIQTSFDGAGHGLRELMVAVAMSDAFAMLVVPEGSAS